MLSPVRLLSVVCNVRTSCALIRRWNFRQSFYAAWYLDHPIYEKWLQNVASVLGSLSLPIQACKHFSRLSVRQRRLAIVIISFNVAWSSLLHLLWTIDILQKVQYYPRNQLTILCSHICCKRLSSLDVYLATARKQEGRAVAGMVRVAWCHGTPTEVHENRGIILHSPDPKVAKFHHAPTKTVRDICCRIFFLVKRRPEVTLGHEIWNLPPIEF